MTNKFNKTNSHKGGCTPLMFELMNLNTAKPYEAVHTHTHTHNFNYVKGGLRRSLSLKEREAD